MVEMALWTARPTSTQTVVHAATVISLNNWMASRTGLVE
ncbi:hypothetical protein BZL30_6605 [Mycobacterium kansasii]|uniref:Uncharacterized protein n=1 Tax=Mycobacterium kansasii TaxID=1768 RepID=A0A1V3WV16_MYCKA|nr:hypothetical protein BZL30_6605 [Mycobacterium kansasii]OOK74462.1 hypothetical protein BZL29_4595 [Mycobacterium kansasii]